MSTATVPHILPDGIYDDLLLGDVLGVSPQVLAAARRAGELRYTRKGKRILYLGRWVLDWLTTGAEGAEAHGPTAKVAEGDAGAGVRQT